VHGEGTPQDSIELMNRSYASSQNKNLLMLLLLNHHYTFDQFSLAKPYHEEKTALEASFCTKTLVYVYCDNP
jgi:hypothetical protein